MVSRSRFMNPEGLSAPTGYTHVVETGPGRTVYIAGQVAMGTDGKVVGVGDMRAQAEQVFKNLQTALASVGAGFDDVVKVTVFTLDAAQRPAIREVRDQYINVASPPASTLVQVSALAIPELLIEVEAIAWLPA